MPGDTPSAAERSLKIEVLDRLSDLSTAGFGFVAALAWNDAIQELFRLLFGTASTVVAKFFYALLITIVVVLVSRSLARMREKLKAHKRP